MLNEIQDELIGTFFKNDKLSMKVTLKLSMDDFVILLDETVNKNHQYTKNKPTSFKEIRTLMFPIIGDVNIVIDNALKNYELLYE